jgi:uncharacterized protein
MKIRTNQNDDESREIESYYNKTMEYQNLITEIAAQYQIHPEGAHGLGHWGRVLEIGLKLSENTKADRQIVTLFAIFHDACRWNDSFDPQHGPRAAVLVEQLLGSAGILDQGQINLLQEACRNHTNGHTLADITIQTCWDSDRLDLERVGISPSKTRLCTEAARDNGMISWASDRAQRRVVPDFVTEEWMPAFSKKWKQQDDSF